MDELRSARRRLGLGDHPTRADVVAAFRSAAKRCHPDRGGDAEEFAELEAMYRIVLSALRPVDHGPYLRVMDAPSAPASQRATERRVVVSSPSPSAPDQRFADILRRELDRLHSAHDRAS